MIEAEQDERIEGGEVGDNGACKDRHFVDPTRHRRQKAEHHPMLHAFTYHLSIRVSEHAFRLSPSPSAARYSQALCAVLLYVQCISVRYNAHTPVMLSKPAGDKTKT